ncbi:hypothetical protein DFQ26_008903 [Actinomortierella ambigua]|nr:hypothetical protein DFQ26_008903 [Actinomortierella ambigua]
MVPLVLVLFLGAASLATARAVAKVESPNPSQQPLPDDKGVCSHLTGRQDCGYLGVTQDECAQRQCCWSPAEGVPWCFHKKDVEYVCPADIVSRRDCGYLGIGQKECNDRNCCWDSKPNNLNGPWCFYKQHTCKGYKIVSQTETMDGLLIRLDLLGGPKGCARYGDDVQQLVVHVHFESDARVRVKISDMNRERYEVPPLAIPPVKSKKRTPAQKYSFEVSPEPFSFKVTRTDTKETVFDTAVAGTDSLVFEDEYLEISTAVPNDADIYGLGEVVSSFRRDTRGTRQTMWARDAATPVGENVYGSQPFYLEMRGQRAHGVFLKNSNGMDVIMTPGKLTYKVLGGVLDFTIFLGPSPAEVIREYTEVIGRPHMPPAWSLGWHQSRYGYKDIDQVEEVVRRYRQENLPLDSIWIDIDYMDKWYDFTYDPVKFPKQRMKAFADNLHTRHQYLSLIVDPGIPIIPGYEPYDSGMRDDIFVKSDKGVPIVGEVWPGRTYFPDFFNTNETWAWWTRQLKGMRDDVAVDGIWIDMNEPASWCNGECTSNGQSEAPKPQGSKYLINNAGRQAPLNEKTVSVTAVHKNGLRMYDTHNLYGHIESVATRHAMLSIDKQNRPFILTRSNFAGTGSHAAHWTGDNWSEWNHLYFSIPGILNFGMFGIPFTGADICGFVGNTTEELCLRWHQLGALYPFARNHNAINMIDQEPYHWPNSVLPAARKAIQIRYSLMPYLYTLHTDAHQQGDPVWRPLFFEFPNDGLTLKIEHQFMMGPSLMVSPALNKGQVQVKAYFPGSGRWFDLWSYELVVPGDGEKNLLAPAPPQNGPGDSTGERPNRYRSLPARIHLGSGNGTTDPIPIHVAGGHVLALQENPQLTVAETRLQPVTVLVALDAQGKANGRIHVDDGKSLETTVYGTVSWEAIPGAPKLVNNGTVVGPSGMPDDEKRRRLEHTQTVEKIVVMGLDVNRGAPAASPTEDRLIAGITINGQQLTMDPTHVGFVGEAAEQRGTDPALGVAWVLNITKGSLIFSGLKLDLFGTWAVEWRFTS